MSVQFGSKVVAFVPSEYCFTWIGSLFLGMKSTSCSAMKATYRSRSMNHTSLPFIENRLVAMIIASLVKLGSAKHEDLGVLDLEYRNFRK